MTRLAIFASTAGYLGYFPIAPGTVGSAAGLAVYALLRFVGSPAAEAVTLVAIALVGVWAGGIAEQHFGAVDPGPVVIDEVFGMLVTLAFLPAGSSAALLGFLLFRLMDIVKPFPSGRLERLPGGWGVMADDGCAALYAHVALRGAMWLAPGWIA